MRLSISAFTLICCLCSLPLIGQYDADEVNELHEILKKKDSLVFQLGYNNCDTAVFRKLLSEDFEFYHDQSGYMDSKEVLLQSFPNLCKMSYKATRELIDSSLKVFPLYSGDELYGAIQTGDHIFYGEEDGLPKYVTSVSKFTHVWVLENKEWKLQKILSYDHKIPE